MTDSSIILSTVGTAIATAQVIEWVKQSPYLNWLISPESSTKIKTTIGVISAVLCAVGIHAEWNESARILSFAIPTFADALHRSWDAVVQFGVQTYVYKTGFKAQA